VNKNSGKKNQQHFLPLQFITSERFIQVSQMNALLEYFDLLCLKLLSRVNPTYACALNKHTDKLVIFNINYTVLNLSLPWGS